MGYFRADEQYLNGAKTPEVEAPWKVEVRESGAPGQVSLTWRPPYTPADSYGIYSQPATAASTVAWQEVMRVPGTTTQAHVTLPPGAWRLAVRARRAGTDSPLVEAARAVPAPSGPIIQVQAAIPSVPPAPEPPPPVVEERSNSTAEQAQDNPQHVVRNTQHATRNTPCCTCCVPPCPLVWQGNTLLCPAHPDRHYGVPVPFGDGRNDRDARRATPLPPPPANLVLEPAPELDWATIDGALRANSAQLGRHGLFVRPTYRDIYDR